uniref:Immunoglobulin domain-containing protein n=1 Tax=Acanthochromis polyacanthus TaxID=80966 RepID=A0A3Q1H517_9TELE
KFTSIWLVCIEMLFVVAGICCLTTVSEVSVKAGDSVTIPCLYDRAYINHVKYLCEGYYWSSYGTRVTIDAWSSKVFTVTMSELKAESSGWYWCAIGNFQMPVHVTVTEKPTTSKHTNAVMECPGISSEKQLLLLLCCIIVSMFSALC